jgi:hypothetical protein
MRVSNGGVIVIGVQMANSRLQHDAAFALATTLLEMTQNCIRAEEFHDAFEAFYEASLAAIQAYDIQVNRMEARLHPSKN